MFWELGSKLKEAVVAQAAQLQLQATDAAKQYMAQQQQRQQNSDGEEDDPAEE